MLYNAFSDELADLLSQDHVEVCIAAEFHFPSGITRVHTGTGNIVIDGYNFYGIGALGNVSSIKEENNTSPRSIDATLTGLDLMLVSTALDEKCVGSTVLAYLVGLKDGVPQASNLLFEGFITSSSVTAGGENNAINYRISNAFEEWAFGLPQRYTDESHSARHQGDRFFRYTPQMADRSIFWGSKKDAPPFNYN